MRGWIALIAQRKKTGRPLDEAYAQAWRMITDVNPFPSVLGRVCPHPCQDGCNRAPKDGAVQVRELERFVGDKGLEMGLSLGRLPPGPVTGSIGVVGAGPAGLSCAYQLARRGHRVTVYERAPAAGGMLRYGIPDYRLPPHVLDAEVERIRSLGVDLRLSTAVGSDVLVKDIHAAHDAVFVGIGAQLGRPLACPGEDGPGVWTGADYLRLTNSEGSVDVGRNVVVVGGGNTAVDACRTARRQGAEVVLLYRRTRKEMPAFDEEVQEMLAEGVRIEFLSTPLAVERDESANVIGVVVQDMVLGPPDESGRRQPTPVDGSTRHIPADGVIAAVSQGPDWHQLEAINPDGGWVHAEDGGVFSENVWVGGDVRGLGFASLAVAQGRKAAEDIHARLCGLALPAQGRSIPGPSPVKLDLYPTRDPPRGAELGAQEALAHPTAEVRSTLEEDRFLEEVDACLSCGSCFGCEHCWMYCSAQGFARVIEPKPGAYFVLTPDVCESCGKCVDVCPCGFLEFACETPSAERMSDDLPGSGVPAGQNRIPEMPVESRSAGELGV